MSPRAMADSILKLSSVCVLAGGHRRGELPDGSRGGSRDLYLLAAGNLHRRHRAP